MGAVRNSNTRASHASVEPAAASTTAAMGSAGIGGPAAGGTSGAASGAAALDSPHLGPETPDRRPSFSYLRRASDRRRRRRLMRGEDPEGGHVRQEYKDFVYPRSGRGRRESGESTAGQDSAGTDTQRRDSGVAAVAGQQQDHQALEHHQQRLRRSDQIYDEESEEQLYLDDPDQRHLHQPAYQQQQQQHQQQHPDQQQDQQRRQSINDRLTDAVSDVMEFVRDESFRRGKRRSMVKRRAIGGGAHSMAHFGHGDQQQMGGSSHGLQHHELDDPTDEFDSGDLQQHQHLQQQQQQGLIGQQQHPDRSPSYRRRRIMRRSPRRSAAAARHLNYNDSDTGSGASLSHEPMMGTGSSRAQRAYRLQQHGGSEQDAGLMAYSGQRGRPGTALLVEQHRRHQSADASSSAAARSRYMMGAGGYYEEIAGGHDEDGMPVGEFSDRHSQVLSATSSAAMVGGGGGGGGSSGIIKPQLAVGSSPPPIVGPLEEEFASDSGQDRHGEGHTSICVASNNQEDDDLSGASARSKKQQSPVRFIAPKVAPLNSPTGSAVIRPDEELIPPDVPYRGRRLPQIPGSGIINKAADFLHSSIYGGSHHHHQAGGTAAAGFATAEHPVAPGGDMSAPVFPLVSESPTTLEAPDSANLDQAGRLQRQQTLASVTAAMQMKPPLMGDVAATGAMGSSLEGSGSINFPRVSFSPTHLPPVTTTGGTGAGAVGGARYQPVPTGAGVGPSTAAAVIATQQATGGATQSAVVAPDEEDWF